MASCCFLKLYQLLEFSLGNPKGYQTILVFPLLFHGIFCFNFSGVFGFPPPTLKAVEGQNPILCKTIVHLGRGKRI